MKNWKTTLVGALAAGANIAATLYQTGTVDVKTLLVSAGIAALGYVAKDAGVTGVAK